MPLPTPGFVGLAIRALLGAAVLYLGIDALLSRQTFWDGFANPAGVWAYILPLALATSWVVNELTGKEWGQKPLIAVLAGLAGTAAWGASQGEPFGPAFGVYLWVWVVLFAGLLGPALVLAVLLRTPGCEMRSYVHLVAKLRGQDPTAVTCPGWIDRFDAVRISKKR